MKPEIQYREIDGGMRFYALLGIIGLFVLAGLGAAWYMEHNGHWVTGMTNQVVWGTPHVFAVFLIVAASGALNVASMSTLFGITPYKPLARLSGLVSICLLIGGLAILVLDLGRPDRLIVAMTYYNFKSIFAWNIFLYVGFLAFVAIYVWMMMERKMNRFTRPVGFFAFMWRLILTTGTGSIFGFLVARQAYDAAVMAPMFIIMSFSFGLAIFILLLMAACKWSDRPLGDVILMRLKNLLGIFIGAVLYFVTVYHLTNLYITEHHGFERFILLDGGNYTSLFWIVQIGLGSLLPLALLYNPSTGKSRSWIGIASLLVIVGGLAQMYVIIIGGQAYPMDLFPGKEVTSSFFDGGINAYAPSLPEFILGVSGVGLALAATLVGVRVLRFLPVSLADEIVDPS
ncbi:MAG: polysulfide reductase NrfD [Gammaproteobacteria bacterium]|nr:polysulfide reductase NrfD [Gammaproteobacteria bacterium]